MVQISLIAAVSENGVIGKDNGIPWQLREDLEHYKQTVDNSVTISGRVTYESIPVIQGRKQVVMSRRETLELEENTYHAQSRDEATEVAKEIADGDETVYIIGGENIYRTFLEIADEMILSHVEGEYEGDTYFPEFEDSNWNPVERDPREGFEIVTYERSQKEI